MCSSRKNPYPGGGGGGGLKSQNFISKVQVYEAKLEVPGGMGGCKTKTFHGGVWMYFSGDATLVPQESLKQQFWSKLQAITCRNQ